MSRLRLGDLLVQVGLIDDAQLKSALAMQRQYGGRLGNILVDNGFLDEMMLWRGLSKQLGLPLISMPDLEVTPKLLATLPKDFVMQHDVFPVAIHDRELTLATSDPSDIAVIDDLQARLGARVKMALAPAREISWAIGFHYQGMRHPCPPPQKKSASSGLDIKTGRDPITASPPSGPYAVSPNLPGSIPPNMPGSIPPVYTNAPKTNGLPTPPVTGGHQTAPPPIPQSGAYQMPPAALPPATHSAAHIARLEATLRETNEVLRYLVDTCVARGVFTREEFLERMRRL